MPLRPDAKVYLREDTKLEPLINRWNAWSHLVSPVAHALNVAFRQVPILRSFISNPRIHISAQKDPALFAGPYVNLTEGDVPAVRSLLDRIQSSCEGAIRFAQDLVEGARRLKAETGFSLDRHYLSLPKSLAGMVEFTYNINNQPQLRLLTSLIEEELSPCGVQELAFTRGRDEDRAFFLNTPRLQTAERLIVELPFGDARFNLLSEARTSPVPLSALVKALQLTGDKEALLEQFVTTEPGPRSSPNYTGDGVRVRCFGHACVLVQTAEVSVLIDPLFAFDRAEGEGRLTFHDLPNFIDYVFISHFHHDHFCPEHLLQLRGRVGTFLVARNNPASLADQSMKRALEALGHRNVIMMDALERLELPDGATIVSVPFLGEHADLDIHSKHAMYLRLKGRAFLFVADSDCKDRVLYQRIARRLGAIDVLFLGMECEGAPLTWLYGPYLTSPVSRKDDESRRLCGSDSTRAWALIEECGCREVFVYAMGQDPWVKYLSGLDGALGGKQSAEADRLLARCRTAGIVAKRLMGCVTMEYPPEAGSVLRE